MKKLAVLIPLALITFGFAAGCGGDSDGDSGNDSEPALTKTEFITQADQICSDANEQLRDEISEQFGEKQPTQEEAIAFTEDTIIPSLESQLDGIESLTPPEGEEENVEAVTSALSGVIDAFKEDPASSLESDSLKASQEAAEEFGFDNCGSGGTS